MLESRPDGRDGLDQLINHPLPLAWDLFVLQRIKRKTQIIRTKPVVLEDWDKHEMMSKGFPVFFEIEHRDFAFLVSSQCIGHLRQRLFFGMMTQLSSLLEKSTILAEPFMPFVSGQIFKRFVAMDQRKSVAVPRCCGQLYRDFGQLVDIL